jgi:hypothetical protein
MILTALIRASGWLWAKLNSTPGSPPRPAPPVAPKPSPIPAQPPPAPVKHERAWLTGPFRYLIAADDQIEGKDGEIFETGYSGKRPKKGRFFRYGNLYDQTKTGVGGTADMDWPPAPIASEAYDPKPPIGTQICCDAQHCPDAQTAMMRSVELGQGNETALQSRPRTS